MSSVGSVILGGMLRRMLEVVKGISPFLFWGCLIVCALWLVAVLFLVVMHLVKGKTLDEAWARGKPWWRRKGGGG